MVAKKSNSKKKTVKDPKKKTPKEIKTPEVSKKKAPKEKKTPEVSKEEKSEDWDDTYWDEDDLVDHIDKGEETESLDDIDQSKLKFTKIKDLKVGMDDVNVEGTIDFIGDKRGGSNYGAALYSHGFIKDATGEIKCTFWNEDIDKAKVGKKVKIIKGNVTEFRGTLQLNGNRDLGIIFS